MSSSRDWRKAVVGSCVLRRTSNSLASAWRVVQNNDVWFRPKCLCGRNMRCLGCRWVCLKVLRYMFANVWSTLRALLMGICVQSGLKVLTDIISDRCRDRHESGDRPRHWIAMSRVYVFLRARVAVGCMSAKEFMYVPKCRSWARASGVSVWI